VVSGFIGQNPAVDLSAFGNLAAGTGTGAAINVTISGAVLGDAVTITPVTSMLGQTAGINFQVISTGGNNVSIQAFNTTASPYDFAHAESGSTPSKVRLEVTRGAQQ
jgi:hypothetical protein